MLLLTGFEQRTVQPVVQTIYRPLAMLGESSNKLVNGWAISCLRHGSQGKDLLTVCQYILPT